VEIVKNQKIDRHPKVFARTPPRSGPRAGPIIAPSWKKAVYFPRSRGSAMSATQPEPMLMTAEPPVAWEVRYEDGADQDWSLTCRARRNNKSQYLLVGHSDRPMFAPRYTNRVPMYTGLLPYESLMAPKKDGVMAWNTRYIVTAKEISCSDRLKASARVGIAGTKMLEEMGLNTPAMPDMPTIKYFVDCGKAEYGLEVSVDRMRLIGGLESSWCIDTGVGGRLSDAEIGSRPSGSLSMMSGSSTRSA
jgi:hypothetical protein